MTYDAARRTLPAWLVRHVYHFESSIEREVSAFAASTARGARVLDAGAGEGQYAHHFAAQKYTGVDLGIGDARWDYRKLDALADLNQLPFSGAAFEAVVNIVTLEHLREPHLALKEMARVLRPGGRLLLIAPHQWEVHQEPHDYFRYTGYGLDWLLQQACLKAERIDGVGGMFRLLSRRLLGALQFFPGLWKLPAALFLVPPALVLPWLDSLDRRKVFTLGYVCVARKPLS